MKANNSCVWKRSVKGTLMVSSVFAHLGHALHWNNMVEEYKLYKVGALPHIGHICPLSLTIRFITYTESIARGQYTALGWLEVGALQNGVQTCPLFHIWYGLKPFRRMARALGWLVVSALPQMSTEWLGPNPQVGKILPLSQIIGFNTYPENGQIQYAGW
jgi:hypothetical protein